ncbi:MAG: hypothetical protein JWO62_47 [Acidimicrobiaceae bacterium]|nr:hypothetical protein [Acidimicrobiaceae bacterium]
MVFLAQTAMSALVLAHLCQFCLKMRPSWASEGGGCVPRAFGMAALVFLGGLE